MNRSSSIPWQREQCTVASWRPTRTVVSLWARTGAANTLPTAAIASRRWHWLLVRPVGGDCVIGSPATRAGQPRDPAAGARPASAAMLVELRLLHLQVQEVDA